MRSPLAALAAAALPLAVLAGCGGADAKAAYPSTPAAYPTAGSPATGYRAAESRTVTVAAQSKARDDEDAFGSREESMPAPAEPPSSMATMAATAGSASPAGPGPTPMPAPAPPPAPQATSPSAAVKDKADPTKEPAQNRDLVIYTARFTMAVYQVDQGLNAVEKIARDNGGYLGQKKDREITVRIPRGRFETTLAAIDRVGDVLHREILAEDVTDEHVDLEIRIKNARAMQRRLSDLLGKASVKDALEIEKELHRVTEELERLEGRMKVLKDRIAFSTITVVFEARGSQIQTQRVRLPFPWLGALNLPSLLSLSEEK
jgi:Domain of unknown function (DUF4349)